MGRRTRQGSGAAHHPGAREQERTQARPRQLDQQSDPPLPKPQRRNVTTVKLAPSILAADFACLGEQVAEAERAGADRIHVDVMDGHFVPNLSMGPAIVKSLRPVTTLPLEVHLMVEEPVQFIEPFVKAGADTIIGHIEVLPDTAEFIATLR